MTDGRAELASECNPDSWGFNFLGLQEYINY